MTLYSNLLEQLPPSDVDWLLSAASERMLQTDDVVIETGERVDALYVVLQGLLGVYVPDVPETLARVGPGEHVGEMSLLEDRLPTESVKALEPTKVLALPHTALQAKRTESPDFAARLHLALARLLATRLRRANRRLAVQSDTDVATLSGNASVKRLAAALQKVKAMLHDADREALANDDVVPEATAARVVNRFLQALPLLNEVDDAVGGDDRLREEIGLRAQNELLPYILLTETAERFYSKPRGYAGDYWTIELIYRNAPKGTGRIGPLVDRCVLSTPAAAAVRNRRGLLAEEIQATLSRATDAPARITSLASGPAAEVFDVLEAIEDPRRATFTLLDIDLQALAFVAERRDRLKLQKSVTLVSENLIHLALGRSQTRIENQALVYSIGLIDYFEDALVIKLMDLIHGMLAEGGRVILGNYHPRNPQREFMNRVLEWRLIHRTEEDMNRLFEASAFGRPCTMIRFEGEGINLFAECTKA